MGDLFGPKWTSRAGEIADESGAYTETFLLWCRKLDGLTDKQFRHGLAVLEERAKSAGQLGDDFWPPSYAEFLGLAGRSAQHALQSRPVHEVLAESMGPLALEDKTAQEARRLKNRDRMAEMRQRLGI